MMQIADLYYHLHLGHTVQITAIEGDWVEFLNLEYNTLAWLERAIFEFAHRYQRQGDPVTVDLQALRESAHQQGILVPWEFGARQAG
jgi:hypothetical protein